MEVINGHLQANQEREMFPVHVQGSSMTSLGHDNGKHVRSSGHALLIVLFFLSESDQGFIFQVEG